MNLLFLSQLYPPEPATMRHQMASELLARNHEVRAITAFPNYPLGRTYPGYKQRPWVRDTVDDVPVVRLPIFPDHGRSAIRRAFCYLSFAFTASVLGPFFSGKPDVIWAYQPPLTVGIPALWLSLLCRCPLVYEIQDLWPETLASTGMMSSAFVFKVLHAFARFVYRRSAAIIVPSPGMKKNLLAKGVPDWKVHIIPNWADETIYKPVPRDPQLAASYGLSGKFNVVFGGNHGAAQALQTVLDAAEVLSDNPDIQFVLIGGGLERNRLEAEASERGLTNVRFIEQQPAASMPAFFALADVLLVHLRLDPLFEIMIPAKTQSYLACGRPILMAVPGDVASLINEAGAGLTCTSEDSKGLADTVVELFRMPMAEREQMGKAGREAFLKYYTRGMLVDQYEELFAGVVRAE
jgi:putative colanic acid biosynthesis glycosyltransferase WcaI